MSYKFSKQEKLKSKKAIQTLFLQNNAFREDFIYVLYQPFKEHENSPAVKVGFSVPKKKVKLAVSRNLIKRRMREAYRLNNLDLKTTLLAQEHAMHLMFIYTSSTLISYQKIELKIKNILQRLTHDVNF